MAQILKEELRKQILKASKEEFLEKGYENASLRNIAKKAHTPVGNLYRYFKNKEDILNKIVEPCLLRLEKLINNETNNQLSFFSINKDFNLDKKNMIKAIDNIMEELINIYDEYKVEFQILMMDSKLSIELKNWFSILVKSLIMNNYKFLHKSNELDSMAHAYSVSIFSGFKELLKNDYSNEEMKMLSKIYFRSYVYMLNSDVNEMIKNI